MIELRWKGISEEEYRILRNDDSKNVLVISGRSDEGSNWESFFLQFKRSETGDWEPVSCVPILPNTAFEV